MRKSKIARIAGFTVALGATASLVGFAASGTGAYFSDSSPGTITGSVGSILVSVSGGNGSNSTDFHFDRLLPGTPQTETITYTNTGNSVEDVFLTFPNATALSALNDLGTFGSVQVGDAGGNTVFDSSNLNDNSSPNHCGPNFSPSGCWPLPNQIKVDSNLAPGQSHTATFTFGYASKLGTASHSSGGGVWNTFPVTGQFTVNSADGSGDGLPIAIVATQVGQTP
jgi:hypothetical protein